MVEQSNGTRVIAMIAKADTALVVQNLHKMTTNFGVTNIAGAMGASYGEKRTDEVHR
jgi:hypothetical protein